MYSKDCPAGVIPEPRQLGAAHHPHVASLEAVYHSSIIYLLPTYLETMAENSPQAFLSRTAAPYYDPEKRSNKLKGRNNNKNLGREVDHQIRPKVHRVEERPASHGARQEICKPITMSICLLSTHGVRHGYNGAGHLFKRSLGK